MLPVPTLTPPVRPALPDAHAGRGRARLWGGNRLGPDRLPAVGPVYCRERDEPTDPERRDRRQEQRHRRAIVLAQERGELSPLLAGVLGALLSFCDGDGRVGVIWPSLATIAKRVRGADWYDGKRAGSRTAGRWMRELRTLGWVQRQHRFAHEGGLVRGTSNRWWLTIPEHLRLELLAQEDEARSRTQRGRSGSGRVTPKGPGRGRGSGVPEPAPSQGYAAAEGRRQALAEAAANGPKPDPELVRSELAKAREKLRPRGRGTGPP